MVLWINGLERQKSLDIMEMGLGGCYESIDCRREMHRYHGDRSSGVFWINGLRREKSIDIIETCLGGGSESRD